MTRRVTNRTLQRYDQTPYGIITVHQAERDQGGSVKDWGDSDGEVLVTNWTDGE